MNSFVRYWRELLFLSLSCLGCTWDSSSNLDSILSLKTIVYSYQYGKIDLKDFADTTDTKEFIYWDIMTDLFEDRDSIAETKLFKENYDIISDAKNKEFDLLKAIFHSKTWDFKNAEYGFDKYIEECSENRLLEAFYWKSEHFKNRVQDYEQALVIAIEGLKYFDPFDNKVTPLEINYLLNLNDLMRLNGRYSEAYLYILLANEQYSNLEQIYQSDVFRAVLFSQYAKTLTSDIKFEASEFFYTEALELFKRDSIQQSLVAQAQANFGLTYHWMNKDSLSFNLLRNSAILCNKNNEEIYSYIFYRCGIQALNQNDFNLAEDYLTSALIVMSGLSKRHAHLGRIYNKLGDVALGRNSNSLALEYYSKAISEIFDQDNLSIYDVPKPSTILGTYNSVDFLIDKIEVLKRKQSSNIDEVKNSIIKHFVFLDHLLTDMLFYGDATSAIHFGEYHHTLFEDVLAWYNENEESYDIKSKEIYRLMQKSRGTLMHISRISENAAKSNSSNPDMEIAENLFLLILRKNNFFEKTHKEIPILPQNSIKELLLLYKKIDVTKNIEETYSPISLDSLNEFCSSRSVGFLQSFYGEEHVYFFSLINGSSYIDVFDVKKLEPHLRNLNGDLRSIPLNESQCDSHYDESNWLWDKCLKRIFTRFFEQGLLNTLVVSDGLFEDFSFDSVVMGIGENANEIQFLLDSINLVYLDGVASIFTIQDPFDIKSNGVLSASYSDKYSIINCKKGAESYDELPFGYMESTFLENSFEGTLTIRGKELTKSALSARMSESWGMIHLATHANSSRVNMGQNYLVTRDENGNYGTDKLYASDIVNIDCNLMIINTCNSGFGRIKKGEPQFSLGRSLRLSGAKCVIQSEWNVEDKSSFDIFSIFFQNIDSISTTIEIANELRLSKLSFIEKANGLKKHPYYWAGYNIYGG